MKAVNLLPGDAPVASAAGGKPNLGMIGGVAFGVVMLTVVSGYFALARVDSVKSEASAARVQAAASTSETAEINSQVQTLGEPTKDSDQQLAQGAEQVFVAAYTERHDFVLLAQELRGIMEGTGGWYEAVEATSASDGESRAVEIVGYMPTNKLAASFNERVNATRTMTKATHSSLESERLRAIDSKRPGVYWKFVISADLVDTVAPSAGGAGDSSATGTVVGDSGTIELSLDEKPAPAKAAAKPKPAAQPANPFDIAAQTAAGGGS